RSSDLDARLDRTKDRHADRTAEVEGERGQAGRDADFPLLYGILERHNRRRDHHPVAEPERDPDDDERQEGGRRADRGEDQESNQDNRGTEEREFPEAHLRNGHTADEDSGGEREGEAIDDVPHIAHGSAEDRGGKERDVRDDGEEHDGAKQVHRRPRRDVSYSEETGRKDRFVRSPLGDDEPEEQERASREQRHLGP